MILILPVVNGILPRPYGGRITGMFIMEHGGKMLADMGVGRDVLVCPWVLDNQALYPVGVIARIMDMRPQTVMNEDGTKVPMVMAVLEGRGQARWHTLQVAGAYVVSGDVESIDLKNMTGQYPSVSGAGWLPSGGYTEFRDNTDIPVVLYGSDLETGKEVNIRANLGGLVGQEQAHTIEHAMIRSLRTFGLCTPKTLIDSLRKETDELKRSVECSFRFAMPELLGVTASGACGNPMTNLAQFYLAKEFLDNVRAGKALNESMEVARRSTMSQLTQDLGLTAQSGLRVLQGLKKGMKHDDTPLKLEICKKVLARFPFDPWS